MPAKFDLQIIREKNKIECFLSCHGDENEEKFNALTDLFDFVHHKGDLYSFALQHGCTEPDIAQARRYIQEASANDTSVPKLESLAGYHKIHMPIIYSESYPFYQELEDITSVAICVLLFLKKNNYKFAQCAHCGKTFATHNLRIKFCSRYSPYKNPCKPNEDYTKLSCGDAVYNINARQRGRKNKIRDYLRKKAEGELYKKEENGENLYAIYEADYKKFKETCKKHLALIRENGPNLSLLSGYDYYLYTIPGVPKDAREKQ